LFFTPRNSPHLLSSFTFFAFSESCIVMHIR
jgi:hypothetical protein